MGVPTYTLILADNPRSEEAVMEKPIILPSTVPNKRCINLSTMNFNSMSDEYRLLHL